MTENELEFLFQKSPMDVAEEIERLHQEQQGEFEEASPRLAAIQARLGKLEGYQRVFAARAAANAPKLIKDAFKDQVDLASKLSYEIIVGQAQWNGGVIARVAAEHKLNGDAAKLATVITTCIDRLLGHEMVNEDLLFRIVHVAVDTLQAIPAPLPVERPQVPSAAGAA